MFRVIVFVGSPSHCGQISQVTAWELATSFLEASPSQVLSYFCPFPPMETAHSAHHNQPHLRRWVHVSLSISLVFGEPRPAWMVSL